MKSIYLDAGVELPKTKYRTLAHRCLDLEKEAGLLEDSSCYPILDDLIDKMYDRIKDKPKDNRKDAINVLKSIDHVFKEENFSYESNKLLNESLITKKINCIWYSAIYLSLTNITSLKLPLNGVNLPYHIFIRWNFDNGDYINWETVGGSVKTDEDYIIRNKISEELIKNEIYLKNLTEDEFLSYSYSNIGVILCNKNKLDEALFYYDQAINLNFKNVGAHNNKGMILAIKGDLDGAIACYDQGLELCPDQKEIKRNKKVALKKKSKLVI